MASSPKKSKQESGDDMPASGTDDVIRIEDLAPRDDVKGGRKILLGEVRTPSSNRKLPPKA